MAKKNQKQKGFTIIEILIGLGLFAVIFIGTSYLLLDNMANSFDNQERVKADFLVAEGLEAVKAIAGNDWDQVQPGTYGLMQVNNQWQLVSQPEKVNQMAKKGERIITISNIDGDTLKKVESKVVWLSLTDKMKDSYAVTMLSNWREFVTICADGLDNDGDGTADYPDDPGCSAPEDDDEYNAPKKTAICSDGEDNDGDGISDYPDDSGCSSASDNDETDPEVLPVCADNLDNDGDGAADYPNDPGCSSADDNDEIDPLNVSQCSDNLDNDGDGKTDYPADPNCISAEDDDETAPAVLAQCSDNLDNDNDGLLDYPADLGCDSADDNQETDPLIQPKCVDADNDGYNQAKENCGPADCVDQDKEIYPGADEICNNGKDDNCDEKIDCAEETCTSALNCQPINPEIIFDDQDKSLCKLDEGVINVTGSVILPPGQSAKLQLSYFIVYPTDKRTEIIYINKGLVSDGDVFSLVTPWPGVRPGEEIVETHIGGMLLDRITGNPLMAHGASLDYYWYPWVCPGPITQCSDKKDNDNDGKIDYPADPNCLSYADDTEGSKSCGVESANQYDFECNNDEETNQLEIGVTNNTNRGLSDVAISLPPGVIPLEPKDGDVYEGQLGKYDVEITNNPYYSIKFNTIGEGMKNGETEVFVIKFSPLDYAKISSVTVQAKSALIIGRVILNLIIN